MMLNGDAFRRMAMVLDWSASHDGIHGVFVNEKSNSGLMFVFKITEEELVAFWGRCFSEGFFFFFFFFPSVHGCSIGISSFHVLVLQLFLLLLVI